MFNNLIDLERLTTFFQGLKDIFLQKSEASTTYATKTEVSNKVDKVEGKGLSTLDYNTSEKSKVDNSINQISVTQNTNNVELNLNKASGNVTAYIDGATSLKAGTLSNTDKSKLDAIPSDPKYTDTIYTHPTNHSASMITESTSRRFVSDTEKADWNNKQDKLTAGTNVTITGTTISATDTVYDDTALKTRITAVENREDKDTTYSVATTTTDGLMSSADKTKVNGIPTNPKYTDTIYTHPANHNADMITESATKRFVSDVEKTNWNNKVDKETGKGLSTNDYNNTEKANNANSINTIAAAANATSVNITGTKNDNTSSIAAITLSTTTTAGLLSPSEKAKITAIPTNPKYTDTVYTHPSTHNASMILTDEERLFVTLLEKNHWNNSIDTITNDYATLNYVDTKNTVSVVDTRNEQYTPQWYMTNHPYKMVFEFKTRSAIGNPPTNATSSSSYTLMLTMNPWRDSSGGYPTQISFGNSIALRRGTSVDTWGNWIELASTDDIPTQLSQLSQDSNNRLVTDNEKAKITAIPTNPKYTDTVYTHPTNHSADMITETTTRKFMTDAEKTKLSDLNYTRALTQAQYDALSTAEKGRTDVWYGTYK